jgi:hypothetical protein
MGQNAQRERPRRCLRDRGFGYLQKSVWITPNPLEDEREILGGGKINVESLILLEARSCAGESGAEMVAGAWDFERINRRYAWHLKVLEERPKGGQRPQHHRPDVALLCSIGWRVIPHAPAVAKRLVVESWRLPQT